MKRGEYTPLGGRIAALGTQKELAGVLRQTQQNISKKLRGRIPVTVGDLELLGRKFKKPLSWFFAFEETCSVQGCREHTEGVGVALDTEGTKLRLCKYHARWAMRITVE